MKSDLIENRLPCIVQYFDSNFMYIVTGANKLRPAGRMRPVKNSVVPAMVLIFFITRPFINFVLVQNIVCIVIARNGDVYGNVRFGLGLQILNILLLIGYENVEWGPLQIWVKS
jgi:hypothetical protein